jgi:transcriptional regulator with XRE-family HTH domain
MSVFNELENLNRNLFNEESSLSQRAFFQFYVGKRIKALRVGRAISLNELASLLSITPEALADWEGGIFTTNFSMQSLVSLAKIFDVLISDFLPPLQVGIFIDQSNLVANAYATHAQSDEKVA